MRNVIISVESRKGGVGKTTAALCMSKVLLEKGYAVLFIDTDITGTNVADCSGSPFWQQNLNILKVLKEDNETENEEKVNFEKVNLLKLFEERFMNGDRLPAFQCDKESDELHVDFNKINIVGSQVYSLDGKPMTISDPAILFDQLHAYWFIDFLKELIENFSTTVMDKPVAVVLDNSPGYVGIAPAIQDWLTDIGPESGKFVIVTSLDNQDIQSCAMAVSMLHSQYKKKWETSRMFYKAQQGSGDNLDYTLMKGGFFVKLAEHRESYKRPTSHFPTPLAFYNIQKSKGEEYIKNPPKYLSAIVNRVSKTVIRHRRTYQPEIFSENNSLFLDLLGGHYSREWSKYMVEYDPYIKHQFSQSGMSKRRYRNKRNINLYKRLMLNEEMFPKEKVFDIMQTSFAELFNRMDDNVSQFQNIIDRAMIDIRANGLDYLADLIDDDWQPKSIVANLKAAFFNFIINADHPLFYEIYREEFEDKRIMEKERRSYLNKIMNSDMTPLGMLEEYPDLKHIILYLVTSLPISVSREFPLDEDFSRFIRDVIKIEIKFIKHIKNKKRDLPSILSSEIKHKINHKELWHKLGVFGKYSRHAEDEFFDFFNSFTSAQARLMTLRDDTRFLILLIQTIVEFENEKPNAIPYIRKIAEDVIVNKTIPYRDVEGRLSKALSEAQYFVDFDKVIKNIVDRWEIGK